jgi:hypothetical protein
MVASSDRYIMLDGEVYIYDETGEPVKVIYRGRDQKPNREPKKIIIKTHPVYNPAAIIVGAIILLIGAYLLIDWHNY